MTPYLEKVICEKSDRVRGSGYLSGRYDKDRSTPSKSLKWVSTNKMKLTWQSMGKSMDTQINLALIKNRIGIESAYLGHEP